MPRIFDGQVRYVATALLTFVAPGDSGRPESVPRLIFETEEERSISEEADRMAEERKGLRKKR